MAASIARRSANIRNLWRTTKVSYSSSPPTSIRSNLVYQHTRISPPLRSPSGLRRESFFLNSLLPFHSAIASACLISKLPNDVSTSSEGRFANYLSPI